MTATPVFEISAVLDNDFTRSNTARAVLHGEIHCRQHTDEIGICLQAHLFECKIVAEDGMPSQPEKLRSCVSSAAMRMGVSHSEFAFSVSLKPSRSRDSFFRLSRLALIAALGGWVTLIVISSGLGEIRSAMYL